MLDAPNLTDRRKTATVSISMASSKQAVTSLLTEHFRYTPLTLLDDIINTVNELVYRAVNAVEEGLSNAPPPSLGFAEHPATGLPQRVERNDEGSDLYPEARAEIENGVHQLETLLQAAVDKNFDKMEIYVLRNILALPEELAPWIRLAHYENLVFPPISSAQRESQEGQLPTTESLHLLRRKLTESRRLRNLLLSERSRNEAMISQLKALLQPQASTSAVPSAQEQPDNPQPSLSFLTSPAAAKSLNLTFTAPGSHSRHSIASTVSVPPTPRTKDSTTQPLTTHTRFLVSQLPALRQLVSTLRSATSEEQGPLRYTRASGAADERREYIESQVKKRLKAQGVDVATGTDADAATGRRPGAEEVKGMEGIARIVNTGKEPNGGIAVHGDGDAMED